ncbi:MULTISPECIES: ComEC/Rec2 family competence protein [unclassified Romboutsia]|uniref:ComEC/Rec2 family competence protein n=1 Tax=unclassified Romboutsia TaxID=2626894 RepID=UPI000822207F|nr:MULTISPECIES: ComEC/Rec2 family competence protein [unclassified Romboutsia]SCH36692.1 ComEC family competence protein [uncultured Clostridium sp.]
MLEIHIIDVGQGDSILIQTPSNKKILIDAGDENSEHIIKSYLKKEKITSLDIAIATHPDSDHIGSLDYVIEKYNVSNIYMPNQSTDTACYKNLINSCSNKDIIPNFLYKNDSITLDEDTEILVLSPSYIQEDNNLNSIVLSLNYKNKSFLFTGDCEKSNEDDMINSFNLENIDFLKVAHHGSSSSSSPEFISEVSPDVAVISCGYKNQYGHPHKSTLDTLNNKNIITYRTDINGDMIFYSDGNTIFTKHKYKN